MASRVICSVAEAGSSSFFGSLLASTTSAADSAAGRTCFATVGEGASSLGSFSTPGITCSVMGDGIVSFVSVSSRTFSVSADDIALSSGSFTTCGTI